jgi:hypothetical protein
MRLVARASGRLSWRIRRRSSTSADCLCADSLRATPYSTTPARKLVEAARRNVDPELDAAGRKPAPLRGAKPLLAMALPVVAFAVLCVATAAPLRAQEGPQDEPQTRSVRRLVHDASRALQAGNAASFLRLFDRKRFAGYPTLESHLVALTTQSDIASSIQIVEIAPTQPGYRLRVDWLLQLSVKETPGPLETRREVLEISAGEEQKGKWRITHVEPVDFFRPQGAGQERSR